MGSLKLTRSIAIYKFDSIFIKTFAILAVFSLFLLLLFSGFVVSDSAHKLIEESHSANRGIVRQAASSADIIAANLCANMNTTMFNKSMIPVVIAPTIQTHEKRAALTEQLRDSVRSDRNLLDSLLYITLTDEIYTAGGSILPRMDYPDSEIINGYLQSPYENLLNIEGTSLTDIRFFGDRLFLFQEFPDKLDVRVGVLVCELDPQHLVETIRGLSNGASRQVWVYRPDGTPVLHGAVGEELPQVLDASQIAGSEGEFSYRPPRGEEQIVFYHRSEYTGLILLYPVPASELRFSFALPPGRIIPFMIVFVVCGLAMALYITGLIYRPIHHLMQTISPPQDTGLSAAPAKNEFDYLSMAYNDIRMSKEAFASMMEGLTPTVLERVFKSCLEGRDIGAEALEKTLNSLPAPFRAGDRYLVVAVMTPGDFSPADTVLEQDVCIVSATNLIHSILEKRGDYHTVRMQDSLIAVILRYAPDRSAIRIKEDAIWFCNQLLSRVEKLPYSLRVGRGRIYNHISDLHFSYRIALEELNYQAGRAVQQESDAPYDKAYFIGRIPHVAELVEAQSYQQARELCTRVVDDVFQHVDDCASARDILYVLAEVLTEQLLRYRASSRNPAVADRLSIEQELEECDSIQSLCRTASAFYQEVLSLLELYSQKALHRHIVAAREIIDRQYTDAGLSLNVVAEQVGIHPSYLSRLFKENLGCNFLDYLNEYRIGRAKALLQDSSITVKEVARQVGFQSMPTFFRVFKKYCGVSPGQYREL